MKQFPLPLLFFFMKASYPPRLACYIANLAKNWITLLVFKYFEIVESIVSRLVMTTQRPINVTMREMSSEQHYHE